MGHEYIVRYSPADAGRWQSFVDRLQSTTSNGWAVFSVATTPEGIYFCDHLHSAEAAIALRRIIDEALAHGHSVVVTEA